MTFVKGQTYWRKNPPQPAPQASQNPFDPAAPLERIQRESGVANMALRDFVMLGPGRSYKKLMDAWKKRHAEGIEPPTLHRLTLGSWATKFQWQARAERYDVLLSEKEQRRWERRFQKLREQEWADAEKLRAVAVDLLADMPKFKKRSEKMTVDKDGNPLKVVTLALGVTLSDVVRALEEASALQRKAVDEPNEHIKLSGTALDRAIASELARLAYPGQTAISGPAAQDNPGASEHRGSREPARNGSG